MFRVPRGEVFDWSARPRGGIHPVRRIAAEVEGAGRPSDQRGRSRARFISTCCAATCWADSRACPPRRVRYDGIFSRRSPLSRANGGGRVPAAALVRGAEERNQEHPLGAQRARSSAGHGDDGASGGRPEQRPHLVLYFTRRRAPSRRQVHCVRPTRGRLRRARRDGRRSYRREQQAARAHRDFESGSRFVQGSTVAYVHRGAEAAFQKDGSVRVPENATLFSWRYRPHDSPSVRELRPTVFSRPGFRPCTMPSRSSPSSSGSISIRRSDRPQVVLHQTFAFLDDLRRFFSRRLRPPPSCRMRSRSISPLKISRRPLATV